MVVPEVNQQLLIELEDMGFPKERATRALHFSGTVFLNTNLFDLFSQHFIFIFTYVHSNDNFGVICYKLRKEYEI